MANNPFLPLLSDPNLFVPTGDKVKIHITLADLMPPPPPRTVKEARKRLVEEIGIMLEARETPAGMSYRESWRLIAGARNRDWLDTYHRFLRDVRWHRKDAIYHAKQARGMARDHAPASERYHRNEMRASLAAACRSLDHAARMRLDTSSFRNRLP